MEHKRRVRHLDTPASSREAMADEGLLKELKVAAEASPAVDTLLRSVMEVHLRRKRENERLRRERDALEAKIKSLTAERALLAGKHRSLADRLNLKQEMKAIALQEVYTAVLLVNPTKGNVVYSNDAAEVLFGPAVGMNAFALFLNTLRPFAESPSIEDSVVREMPVSYGQELWRQVREGGEAVFERVQLKTVMSRIPVDAMLVMKSIRDENDHPWILVEAVEIGRINKDAMTGLFRREVAISALKRALPCSDEADQRMDSSPISVVMLDIDNLKRCNSLYGYEGGNRVIEKTAAVIASEIRPRDIACRWFSGDEFLLVLYGDRTVAMSVAERILRRVRTLSVRVARDADGTDMRIGVSVSIGCAERLHGDDWASITKRAEEELKRSKDGGKGRVSAQHRVVIG